MFFDISKAFDKVWYEGLIYKLKQNGITRKTLNMIKDFLDSRKRRVVLNGQKSSWANATAAVLQGPILGLLFFLIYIDLSIDLSSSPKLFAKDTSPFSVVHDMNISTNKWLGCSFENELQRRSNQTSTGSDLMPSSIEIW